MTSEDQVIYDEIFGVDRMREIAPVRSPSGKGHAWKGGRRKNSAGYVMVVVRNHPRANGCGYVFEHVLIAERALGRFLKNGECVHHVNQNRQDNRNSNLIICDVAFHGTLHRMLDAYRACGNSDWFKCPFCKQHDAKENLRLRFSKESGHIIEGRHRHCEARYKMIRRGALTEDYKYKRKEINHGVLAHI